MNGAHRKKRKLHLQVRIADVLAGRKLLFMPVDPNMHICKELISLLDVCDFGHLAGAAAPGGGGIVSAYSGNTSI